MSPKTLLLDGDMIIHRSCVAVEKDVRFDDRFHILFSDFESAWGVLQETLGELTDAAGTSDVYFCLSDPDSNWRKALLDGDYKGHRKSSRKPLAYFDVIDKIKEQYPWGMEPTLEADDLLGIMQTTSPDETIIWSLDKDLKQIPGFHLSHDEVIEITEDEAHWFHMYQTLVGDTADGYPGCPGVGDQTARRALDGCLKVVPVPHELKSGKNKGQLVLRWEETLADNLWDVVVSYYEKAGLTKEDALHQARISRILHKDDYSNNEVKLWENL